MYFFPYKPSPPYGARQESHIAYSNDQTMLIIINSSQHELGPPVFCNFLTVSQRPKLVRVNKKFVTALPTCTNIQSSTLTLTCFPLESKFTSWRVDCSQSPIFPWSRRDRSLNSSVRHLVFCMGAKPNARWLVGAWGWRSGTSPDWPDFENPLL